MGSVEQSVEVAVPLERVYDAWTRFEEFPEFMEGVEDVTQIDETHVRWRERLAGVDREFVAEITEQRPCQRIAWQAIAGDASRGVVTFARLGDTLTRLTFYVEDDDRIRPRFQALRVQGDLDRFKSMMEAAPPLGG